MMRKIYGKIIWCSCILLLLFSLPGCGGSKELSFSSAASAVASAETTEAEAQDDIGAETDSADESSDAASGQQENDDMGTAAEDAADGTDASETQTAVSGTVFVHVCGAVVTPGVYELSADARIYEALEAAGGCTLDGSPDSLNLAQGVSDGQRIYVPTEEEAAAAAENGDSYYDTASTAASAYSGSDVSEGTSTGTSSDSTLVNINTATKEELMTLTGIGKAKAESIIQYREEHGNFQTIEDLMEISGIKEGVFEKIKDSICV